MLMAISYYKTEVCDLVIVGKAQPSRVNVNMFSVYYCFLFSFSIHKTIEIIQRRRWKYKPFIYNEEKSKSVLTLMLKPLFGWYRWYYLNREKINVLGNGQIMDLQVSLTNFGDKLHWVFSYLCLNFDSEVGKHSEILIVSASLCPE